MAKQSVLIVEDEPNVHQLVDYNLVKEGFSVAHAASGEAALELVREKQFDIIVLDLMLPGLDGLRVCQRLRKLPETRGTPVVVLTARNDEADIVTGLNLGADDYITKPFSPKVLVARIRAVLRRALPSPAEEGPSELDGGVLEIHQVMIDSRRRRVLVSGEPIELTATEFDLLLLLASQPGVVFSRRQIINNLHGADSPTTDRTVDVQVAGLRKKLGLAGQYIDTVRAVGYRFRD
jgi:two-component system phosphate regulon response regulator PhoB